MYRTVSPAVLFLLFVFCRTALPQTLAPADILSGNEPDILYILEHDACRIDVFSTKSNKVIKNIPLPCKPERMRWFPDKKHIAVAGTAGSTVSRPLTGGSLTVVDIRTNSVSTVRFGCSLFDVAVRYDAG
ncbi:MAG: hypothetical protein LBN39_12135, partial [Planctomycetaceae bacterium]|nr:hypothetical protein [Planctomycetaceae bacterium]